MAKFETKRRKTGGRVAGTPNKVSGVVRSAISKAVNNYYNSKKFVEDLAELEPKDRVSAMEKLVSYVAPKLQTTTLDVMAETKQTIEDRLIELSKDDKKQS